MKITRLLLLSIIILYSCQSTEEKRFITEGIPSNIELNGFEESGEGFLKSTGDFSIKSDEVITGDNIQVTFRLSIDYSKDSTDESMCWVNIFVGDNRLTITDYTEKDIERGLFLRGPSIKRTEKLGDISDFISPNIPFELLIVYNGDALTYSIDGKEVYSNTTQIPPQGNIRADGYTSALQIYDLTANAQYKTVAELYTKEFMLDRAHKSVAAAAEMVKDDPNRPAYHFQPPAHWNNDPNGVLYYNGYYHMFYQHNPYSDVWSWMHWGHARSKDLVHWEHLPIALWPSVEKGEWHCFSGSGFIMDDGSPILFYTSIGHELPEHWAAVPVDDELIDWEKHPDNPLIVMEDHNGEMIDDWRDPFLFREQGETYMVISGHPKGKKGSIMMYKALNSELTKWEYLGSPFEGQEKNWECPNFFKIGDKYVLIYSPHNLVEYYSGTLDIENMKFIPDHHGIIDNGAPWNYYAPNALQMEDGRRILFGWIGGFKPGQGWQGAISLPRELSLDEKGRLIQLPVKEVNRLRGDLVSEKNIQITSKSRQVDVPGKQFDLLVTIAGDGANNLGFRFIDENSEPYEIIITPQNIFMGEQQIKVDPEMGEKIRNVRFMLDRTIVEIFVNDGLIAATNVVYPHKNKMYLEIFNTRERINIESLDIWNMESIWNK